MAKKMPLLYRKSKDLLNLFSGDHKEFAHKFRITRKEARIIDKELKKGLF